MRNDIRGKLQTELNKKIEGEPQVVYILSRARKILEIDKTEEEYKKLKFYCDWALHSTINNVGAVKDLLDGIVVADGKSGSDLTMQFSTFHEEFKRFLEANELSTTLYDSGKNTFLFNMFLSQIYADTPLIVDGKTKISWLGRSGEMSYGGSFEVGPVSESGS